MMMIVNKKSALTVMPSYEANTPSELGLSLPWGRNYVTDIITIRALFWLTIIITNYFSSIFLDSYVRRQATTVTAIVPMLVLHNTIIGIEKI